jgi:glyoxylase-like metal-dependent hydrolase (beta-lactamase superfamily II)
LRVRIGGDEVVMTGDACYLRRTLDNFHLPTAMYDREQMLESIRRLRTLRDGGAMIITGHDPDLWKTIPQAPDRLVAVRPGG